MPHIAIVFACASFVASGRRVHTSSEKLQSIGFTESHQASKSSDALLGSTGREPADDSKPKAARALNRILQALDPAAAFKLPGGGMTLPASHHAARGHSRQRTPAMSLKEDRKDQQLSDQESEEKQTAKQLAAVAMSAAILTQAANPAFAGYDPVVADVVYKGHYFGLALVFLSLLAQQSKIDPRMSPDDFNQASIANKVFYLAGAVSLVTGILLVTQYGKGWYFYSREPTFWFKMELLAVVTAFSVYPTTKISQRAAELGENADQSVKRMSQILIGKLKEKYNNMFIAAVFAPFFALAMARGIGYFDWWPWPVGALPPVLTLVGVGYSTYQEALAFNDADYRKAEEFKREQEKAERIARVEASITEAEDSEEVPVTEATSQEAPVKLNLPKKKSSSKFDDV